MWSTKDQLGYTRGMLCLLACALMSLNFSIDTIPGSNEKTMVCAHGYGGNHTIGATIKEQGNLECTLLSFDFPDHDLGDREYDPHTLTFGSFAELEPLLLVLKQEVVCHRKTAIDLYGFSAGGGAVINALAVLNSSTYEAQLERIGISPTDKEQILCAVQEGLVILDTPLKSVEEIIEGRGSSEELESVAKHYRENAMRPIDTVCQLDGLCLRVLLHFQRPDEVLYNRDDALFIERLQRANRCGQTWVVVSDDGGHLAPHTTLWKRYHEITSTENQGKNP